MVFALRETGVERRKRSALCFACLSSFAFGGGGVSGDEGHGGAHARVDAALAAFEDDADVAHRHRKAASAAVATTAATADDDEDNRATTIADGHQSRSASADRGTTDPALETTAACDERESFFRSRRRER